MLYVSGRVRVDLRLHLLLDSTISEVRAHCTYAWIPLEVLLCRNAVVSVARDTFVCRTNDSGVQVCK